MRRLNSIVIFLLGVILGSIIAVLLAIYQKHHRTEFRIERENIYEKWFTSQKYHRSYISADELRYGNTQEILTEDNFLYQKVNVLCIVFVKKKNNAVAINNTWGQYCNDKLFYSLPKSDKRDLGKTITKQKIDSSWHLLCDLLRSLQNRTYEWAFFVSDDTFALVQNLRRFLAPYNYIDRYYFGHAVIFWNTVYNVAEAGYVLSRGAVDRLTYEFNSSESCKKTGRFWKQEDFYLGKHLSSMNITPSDTRDEDGLSIFHGYNLYQLLFPGSITKLANYYKFSLYPVECCSRYSVTFQSIEADKMYMYHYILYQLQVFSSGNKGNGPAPTPIPEDEVWKSFLREHNIFDYNISSEKYYNLWTSEVADPRSFNERLRNTHSSHSGPSGGGFINMPDVLSSLLNKYAHELQKERRKK